MSIHRLLGPIMTKLKLLLGRGKLHLVEDGGGDLQRVQASFLGDTEVHDGMARPQDYGFTSRPRAGSVFTAFPGGDRSAGIVLAIGDNLYRLPLEVGEVGLYDDLGQRVHLTRDGIVVSSPLKLRFEAPKIEVHATEYFRWDVNGHGQIWYPTKVDTWQIGETAGAPHPISPPEIG